MAAIEPPLPFLELAKEFRDKKLTRDEYLNQLCLHCLPQFHEATGWDDELKLRDTDGLGYLFMSFHDEIDDVEDPEKLEDVFQAYQSGTVDDVVEKLDGLSEETSDKLQSALGLLALQDRNLPMLRYLLENERVDFDLRHGHAFEDEANGVQRKKERELYDMIENSTWRSVCRWRKPGARDERGE